jgi:small nuclear ribonucleoprotein (snRNP)-like protein
MVERPLDLLNESKGAKVLVYCKENKAFSGKLIAFDIHINVVLDNMKELDEKGEIIKSLGLSFIRGDTIKFISPGEK